MKAWTYDTAPAAGPYWQSHGVNVILVEHDNGRLEWRTVDTGELHLHTSGPYNYHKGRLLAPEAWPQWYRDFDDCGMDVGL